LGHHYRRRVVVVVTGGLGSDDGWRKGFAETGKQNKKLTS
jgi:hypothetical protein